MGSRTRAVSPAGRRVVLKRKDRLSMEKRKWANLKKTQPKSRKPCHHEEDLGPTATLDKIEKINRTREDVISSLSLHQTDSIQHICQRVENLTHYIENDIQFLKKVHNSLKKKREEKISKVRHKITWAERFRANTSSFQGNPAYKPQCRTVEVRSSSKDGFPQAATRDRKQKEPTASKTQPKRLPPKELPPKIHQPKEHLTSQDKMTWAERFRANSFSSQAINTHHASYSANAFKQKCRTVEVRSSSKDSFSRPAARDLKQKELTPIKTAPKERPPKIFQTGDLPEEELPEEEILLPKYPVKRNPRLEKSTQRELPARPISEDLIIKKRLPKADLRLKDPGNPLPKMDRPPEELARRVSGGCNCNCKQNYCPTESRSQQTSFGMEVSERKRAEMCDKETEVTLREAFSPKACKEDETIEVDEHMFQDYMELYYLEEKISNELAAKPLKRNQANPNRYSDKVRHERTEDLPPRSSMSKDTSCSAGKRGHKSTDKNRFDIGDTRNEDHVKCPSYPLPRRQVGGTNTETHCRMERLLLKDSLPISERSTEVNSKVNDTMSTPEAIVVSSHSQPKDPESHKISEDTVCRRLSSAEESDRYYDDLRVDIKPREYQLRKGSGSGIQPRNLDHEDDGSTRISTTKEDSIHSGSESDGYETARSTFSNKTKKASRMSSVGTDYHKYFPKSCPHDSRTSQCSSTSDQSCIECSFDDWAALDSCTEDERPMPNICPCMYEIYRELEAMCLNMKP